MMMIIIILSSLYSRVFIPKKKHVTTLPCSITTNSLFEKWNIFFVFTFLIFVFYQPNIYSLLLWQEYRAQRRTWLVSAQRLRFWIELTIWHFMLVNTLCSHDRLLHFGQPFPLNSMHVIVRGKSRKFTINTAHFYLFTCCTHNKNKQENCIACHFISCFLSVWWWWRLSDNEDTQTQCERQRQPGHIVCKTVYYKFPFF